MMTENFPKLISDTKANVQEAQRTLGKINEKKKKKRRERNYACRYIIFKL